MKIKRTNHPHKKLQRIVPTLFGTLVLLIVTGLLFQVFVYGIHIDSTRNVLADSIETVTLLPQSYADYANEDGSNFSQPSASSPIIWLGNGQSASTSFLGIRFSGATIPKGSQIVKASVEFIPKETTWISLATNLGVELNENPQQYSSSDRPSGRALSSQQQTIKDNVQWLANTSYSYDISKVIQSVGTLHDKSTVNIILKGTGSSWGRKYVLSGAASATSPKLKIVYRAAVTTQPTTAVTIQQPTATPTTAPAPTVKNTPLPSVGQTMMPTPSTVSGGNGNANAASFGLWDPADPKYAAAGPQKYPTCTKAFHDSFYVIASDGKKYPTWHPPIVVDPATGKKCSFGHEHGSDPSKSALWSQVQSHFYFDTNKNGVMDASEQAVSGIPFGYANEQLDLYSQAKGSMIMRHEDHVGHKVEWANGEADTDGGSFNTNATGGIVIPIIQANNGNKWKDSGAKCYYLTKVHQGVSTFDAFTNNLHEVIFFADCKGPNSSYDQKAAIAEMVAFGAPGEFTNLCTSENDRTSPVIIGTTDLNKNFPGQRGNGTRSIIQRSCIERNFLVPSTTFSMNMYEEWDQSLKLQMTNGKTILSGVNMAFDVEEANRYYYPGKPNNMGYSMDLCYEVLANGNRARSGICDSATNYGQIKNITWNDTRSAFKGIHRGMYFQGPTLNNASGATTVYTDPYGTNGQTTPFPGSIKQELSAKNVDYSTLGPTDPRQVDREHNDGEGTVHAPN